MTSLESALPWIIVPRDKVILPSPRRELTVEKQAEITEMQKTGIPIARIRKHKGNKQYLVSSVIVEWKKRQFLAYRCSCPNFRHRMLAAAKNQGVLTKIQDIEGYLIVSPPQRFEIDKHVWYAIKNGLLGDEFVETLARTF